MKPNLTGHLIHEIEPQYKKGEKVNKFEKKLMCNFKESKMRF